MPREIRCSITGSEVQASSPARPASNCAAINTGFPAGISSMKPSVSTTSFGNKTGMTTGSDRKPKGRRTAKSRTTAIRSLKILLRGECPATSVRGEVPSEPGLVSLYSNSEFFCCAGVTTSSWGLEGSFTSLSSRPRERSVPEIPERMPSFALSGEMSSLSAAGDSASRGRMAFNQAGSTPSASLCSS